LHRTRGIDENLQEDGGQGERNPPVTPPFALAHVYEFRNHPGERPMSDDNLKAELERLRSENAALKKGSRSSVRMKVSEKGALSVYGMGRFPVTLYKEQWLRLLDMADEIRAFIAANDSQLKAKE
jgi:hypothetical protein